MGWYFVAPAIPFLIAIFTPARLAAVGAAIAGMVAGMAACSTLGLHTPIGFIMLVFVAIVFAAMAFAEAAAASVLSGGGLVSALGVALVAHGGLYAVIVMYGPRMLAHMTYEEYGLPVLLVPPALLGGAAAAVGARLGRRRA